MNCGLRLAFSIAFINVASGIGLAHDHWINQGQYRSLDGSLCCGDNDCVLIADDNVKISPAGYRLSNGEVIPFTEALISEDSHYWRCKRPDGSRRCFFAPRGAT
jgi:hypothetical protein